LEETRISSSKTFDESKEKITINSILRGKYRLVEKLGGGAMGVVYKAIDTKLNRPVALKFLSPELTGDSEAKEYFIQEAQAASILEHQNICTIHEIDETDEGQLYIAMSFYPGETLKDKIRRGPFPIGMAIDVVIQIAQGLSKAHEHGIVHRDIKPANMWLKSLILALPS
jgi:serine/threonine protein kinase